MSVSQETTQILVDLSRGDATATERLLPLVYDELRTLAMRSMRRERPGHTLQVTALANDAFMRLVDQTKVDWKGRTHFLAVAATVIRRILVDHARKRAADKRGGGANRITICDVPERAGSRASGIDILALDEALTKLASLDARQARVVELRFLAGLNVQETAETLGVSERTVKGDWRVARVWLEEQLSC